MDFHGLRSIRHEPLAPPLRRIRCAHGCDANPARRGIPRGVVAYSRGSFVVFCRRAIVQRSPGRARRRSRKGGDGCSALYSVATRCTLLQLVAAATPRRSRGCCRSCKPSLRASRSAAPIPLLCIPRSFACAKGVRRRIGVCVANAERRPVSNRGRSVRRWPVYLALFCLSVFCSSLLCFAAVLIVGVLFGLCASLAVVGVPSAIAHCVCSSSCTARRSSAAHSRRRSICAEALLSPHRSASHRTAARSLHA